MREKSIEVYLVKAVKQMGGIALKLNSMSMVGLPDRMILLPRGIIFYVETKTTGKKARLSQLSTHKLLKNLGFDVYVIDTKEQIRVVLKYYAGIQATQLSKNSN